MLNDARTIGFIPTRNAELARPFYEQVLGLTFVSDDSFALVFQAGTGTMVRVVRAGDFTPVPYTILGWEVTAIAEKAKALTDRGVSITRYSFLEQDASGIWTTPSGDKVLWFTDPDGNTLSLSEQV